jgi:hypothetical protein
MVMHVLEMKGFNLPLWKVESYGSGPIAIATRGTQNGTQNQML